MADALATGTAYTVALAVFALFASPRARVSPDQKLPDQKLPDQKLPD